MSTSESAATKRVRSDAFSVRRVLVGSVVGIVVSVGAALAYCVPMPGDSYRGPSPRLTRAEVALAEELRTHVRRLSVDIGVRRAPVGDSLKQAEAYIHEQLSGIAYAQRIRREPLQNTKGTPVNVVLDLPGQRNGPLVLIGAHYDSAPGGTPAANDNASGVAAALALATRLARVPHALPIRIVFFANEEPPYYRTAAMGSLQHAAGCRRRGEWQQGEFHHDTVLRVDAERAGLPGPILVVATNCNGGVKEVLCFRELPDRLALWHRRCPDNPEFSGDLPDLLASSRTLHWFDPCDLLKADARSEYRSEFRERQQGGGWQMKSCGVARLGSTDGEESA